MTRNSSKPCSWWNRLTAISPLLFLWDEEPDFQARNDCNAALNLGRNKKKTTCLVRVNPQLMMMTTMMLMLMLMVMLMLLMMMMMMVSLWPFALNLHGTRFHRQATTARSVVIPGQECTVAILQLLSWFGKLSTKGSLEADPTVTPRLKQQRQVSSSLKCTICIFVSFSLDVSFSSFSAMSSYTGQQKSSHPGEIMAVPGEPVPLTFVGSPTLSPWKLPSRHGANAPWP